MIDFRDFAWCFGIICRGDMTERLKLMYHLHLPPAMTEEDLEEQLPESPMKGTDASSIHFTRAIIVFVTFSPSGLMSD